MNEKTASRPSILKIRNGARHLPSKKVIRPSTTTNVFSASTVFSDRSKSASAGISLNQNSKREDERSNLPGFHKCGKLQAFVRRLQNAKATISPKTSPSERPRIEESLEIEDNSDTETLLEEEITKKYTTVTESHYVRLCRMAGVTPLKCYVRQINSSSVNLSNCQMTRKEIKPLAVCLMHNSIIDDIDLSENDIGPIGMKYIAEIIEENVFITSLNLSKVNMQLKGFRSLMDALTKNRTIENLNISGNCINVNFAVDLAAHISSNDYIQTLDLSENNIDDEAAKIIAPAIANNMTIRKLSLRWNHIRLHGASEIAKAIIDNTELKEVDLSWNGLSEDGCKVFGECLPKNHSLLVLDLSYNRICFKSLGHLLKGLQNNDGLTTLRLYGNPVTTDGAITLLKTIESSTVTKIEELDIRDVSVNKEFMNSLEQLTRKKSVIVHYRQPITYGLRHNIKQRELKHFDPLVLLFEYMKQENMRLIDLFRAFDSDQDGRVTKNELKEGFKTIGIHLTDTEIDELTTKIDINNNAVLEYEEFKRARTQNVRKQKAGGDKYKEMINHIKEKLSENKREKINSAKTREKSKREREKQKLLSNGQNVTKTVNDKTRTTSNDVFGSLVQQTLNPNKHAESEKLELDESENGDHELSKNNAVMTSKFTNLIRIINRMKNYKCNEKFTITND